MLAFFLAFFMLVVHPLDGVGGVGGKPGSVPPAPIATPYDGVGGVGGHA